MNRKALISTLIVVAGITAAGGLAYAAQKADQENDAIASLASTRLSPNDAIAAAEAQAHGKATRAELEAKRGSVFYDVEVVTQDKQVFDVRIDATDGRVLSSRLDKTDDGEDDDD